jgi:amidophosphoribosyltransferase
MCGVVGIVSSKPVNQAIYDALTVMQHRGQDAAGIVTWGKRGLKQRRSNGLVRDVFRHRHMLRLRGKVGIGHVRYPTAGGSKSAEAQPFYVNSPYGICLAHNGNLTNHDELAELLINEDRRHLSTDSDSEVLLNVFAHELHIRANGHPTPDQVFDAVEALHKRCKGGYAVVALIVGHGIVAFRDPNGIRPLVVGERKSGDSTDYMVASESVALDVLQFDRLRDLKPGETIYIENAGRLHCREHRGEVRHTPCIFEYVYFARPDSILDDISVYKARLRMGEQLAGKVVREFPDHDIDVVIPIPDTSRTAALQVAYHLGVKYREGFAILAGRSSCRGRPSEPSPCAAN